MIWWQHFRAFLWLRWRIRLHQLQRGGVVNAVLFAFVVALGVFLGITLFVTGFLVGLFALPAARPEDLPSVLLYTWDGVVAGFLFFWLIGLLNELQRSEALSLDKFLHLPVSLTGAYLINYLSSLLNFTLIVFVPGMVGLGLGLVFGVGPRMLLLLPLVAALLLAVTALTYQFQSWLAALMVNKRRRRTVIVLVTACLILVFQLPQLLNAIGPWHARRQSEVDARRAERQAELERANAAGQVTPGEYVQRLAEIRKEYDAERQAMDQQMLAQTQRVFRITNMVLPPGWLPLGAMGLAEGNPVPALLGTLGLGLLGSLSLWRAYRTTLRLYTGQYTAGGRKRPAAAPRAPAPAQAMPSGPRFMERQLPWVSEYASAIALGGFRSLLRAPEAKMMLLGPAIMVVVFGSLILVNRLTMPEQVRPLLAFGAMTLILFSMVGLAGNQFGLDRNGFRVFVLCPAPRRDILLGKNLAAAPLALLLCAVFVGVLEAVYPMRLGFLLALPLQFVSMYLLFCLLANCLAILAPMRINAGSLKPSNPKLVPVLLQMVFMFLMPAVMAPTLLPLGAQLLLEALGWPRAVPVCLLLAAAECVGVVYLYRLVLTWEGRLLHLREQKILDVVMLRAE